MKAPITASFSHGPSDAAILVHGGAGDVAVERRALHVAGCERAAAAAAEILSAGGTALDAVERAVTILEDDPLFNAGTGACLTADGTIELDAAIMDGARLAAGAVCALPPFSNPIRIARRVMEATPHLLLAGEGAARFAELQGFVRADPDAMITEDARARLARARARRTGEAGGGTVGAVARDANGRVAAATSTGGMVDKLVGRVGDSPILGAGTYADADAACSTTGHGESMMRVCLAKSVTDALARTGERAEDGICSRLAAMFERTGGTGGAIAVTKDGSLALARTTQTMTWAACVIAGGSLSKLSGA